MAKVGRPTKYINIENRLDEVEKLAGYGLTEQEIADFLNISRKLLNDYKNKYPDFLNTLKRGKLKADSNVIEKLYKRTQGYEYEEVTTEGKLVDNKIVPTFIKKVKKHIAPDVTACMCWLNNRRKQDWRPRKDIAETDIPRLPEFDNMSNEQLEKFIKTSVN